MSVSHPPKLRHSRSVPSSRRGVVELPVLGINWIGNPRPDSPASRCCRLRRDLRHSCRCAEDGGEALALANILQVRAKTGGQAARPDEPADGAVRKSAPPPIEDGWPLDLSEQRGTSRTALDYHWRAPSRPPGRE